MFQFNQHKLTFFCKLFFVITCEWETRNKLYCIMSFKFNGKNIYIFCEIKCHQNVSGNKEVSKHIVTVFFSNLDIFMIKYSLKIILNSKNLLNYVQFKNNREYM